MIALWLVLACGGTASDTDVTEPTEPAVERVLDDDAYRFCHEPGLDADAVDEWCALLEGLPEDQCPGMRETCAGADPVESSSGCNEGGRPEAPQCPSTDGRLRAS